jgi:hypothetical protein
MIKVVLAPFILFVCIMTVIVLIVESRPICKEVWASKRIIDTQFMPPSCTKIECTKPAYYYTLEGGYTAGTPDLKIGEILINVGESPLKDRCKRP